MKKKLFLIVALLAIAKLSSVASAITEADLSEAKEALKVAAQKAKATIENLSAEIAAVSTEKFATVEETAPAQRAVRTGFISRPQYIGEQIGAPKGFATINAADLRKAKEALKAALQKAKAAAENLSAEMAALSTEKFATVEETAPAQRAVRTGFISRPQYIGEQVGGPKGFASVNAADLTKAKEALKAALQNAKAAAENLSAEMAALSTEKFATVEEAAPAQRAVRTGFISRPQYIGEQVGAPKGFATINAADITKAKEAIEAAAQKAESASADLRKVNRD